MVVRSLVIRFVILLWRSSVAVRDNEATLEASALSHSRSSTREIFQDKSSRRLGASELSEPSRAQGLRLLQWLPFDSANIGVNLALLLAPNPSEKTSTDDTGLGILAALGILSTFFVCIVFAVVIIYIAPHEKEPESSPEASTKVARPRSGSMSITDDSEASMNSVQFFTKLEEIVEQLAIFLRTDVRSQLDSQHQKPGKYGTWYYVAAVPQTLAKTCTCGNMFLPEALVCDACGAARPEVGGAPSTSASSGILYRMERWQQGSLAWWTSKGHFERGLPPVGGMYIEDIVDVLYDVGRDPTNVVVHNQSVALDRVFIFDNWKQAKTWASNLIAFIEQANGEYL